MVLYQVYKNSQIYISTYSKGSAPCNLIATISSCPKPLPGYHSIYLYIYIFFFERLMPEDVPLTIIELQLIAKAATAIKIIKIKVKTDACSFHTWIRSCFLTRNTWQVWESVRMNYSLNWSIFNVLFFFFF